MRTNSNMEVPVGLEAALRLEAARRTKFASMAAPMRHQPLPRMPAPRILEPSGGHRGLLRELAAGWRGDQYLQVAERRSDFSLHDCHALACLSFAFCSASVRLFGSAGGVTGEIRF